MHEMMNTKKWLNDIELIGDVVKLVPLTMQHKRALMEAASDGQLWKLWYTSVPNENTIDDYLSEALKEKDQNKSLPFVVVDQSTSKIIGSTRFCNAFNNNRIEIGYTWYAKSFQRTAVNSQCKYLLLRHAFETLQCIAVEFRTHWHNHASRAAIARLGAKQDGVLRNHYRDGDGVIRDTVVFSITQEQWPAVKKALAFNLKKYI